MTPSHFVLASKLEVTTGRLALVVTHTSAVVARIVGQTSAIVASATSEGLVEGRLERRVLGALTDQRDRGRIRAWLRRAAARYQIQRTQRLDTARRIGA